MKVVTWNIGEDERNESGKLNIASYEYIVDTIKENSIDIICLQEAIIKSDYLPSIADYIKDNTSLKYIAEFELSDSHINIGCRMGVVICSKEKIENYETFMLDNPKFIYSVDNTITYYSHDKGFIISKIADYTLITGHCLPFHVFKKNPLDYLGIFTKADAKFLNLLKQSDKFILCGDFNYENINSLFPEIMSNCTDLIIESTRKDKQLDHFIVNENINVSNINVIDNYFDHKICIVEID